MRYGMSECMAWREVSHYIASCFFLFLLSEEERQFLACWPVLHTPLLVVFTRDSHRP